MAYSEALWQEAKKKCRLSNQDIQIARELALNPKSLIKNIPNKSEPWKSSVHDWIRDIQADRINKALAKAERNTPTPQAPSEPSPDSNS